VTVVARKLGREPVVIRRRHNDLESILGAD
jgi:hypothetical protein